IFFSGCSAIVGHEWDTARQESAVVHHNWKHNHRAFTLLRGVVENCRDLIEPRLKIRRPLASHAGSIPAPRTTGTPVRNFTASAVTDALYRAKAIPQDRCALAPHAFA